MLYLAEVQKKVGTFGVGAKAEFKLLASQRSEQNWNAEKEEVIADEQAKNFEDGELVLIELSASKQVQRPPQKAGRPLVAILQNFSKLQEKFKNQEEEIETWKQSLTYQAQELNRREMEMQARQEQLEALEEESEKIEEQRLEIEKAREEADRLKSEIERNQQELEGAWAQLRGAQQRLEEGQAQLQQASVLDEEQSGKIQEILNRLSGAIAPTESVRSELNQVFELANSQQGNLDSYWQKLDQQSNAAEDLQAEVDRITADMENRKQQWQQAEEALAQANSELKTQQKALSLKQEYAETLGLNLKTTEELYQQINQLAESAGQVIVSVDLEALEKMPIEELQGIVGDLQRDLDKASGFVKDQEEELQYQLQAIDELKQKIEQASEYDRLTLETELSGEEESYQYLNESLVGSRRNLREREEILNQHEVVLKRRQGFPMEPGKGAQINLGPVLEQLETQRQAQTEELQKLEGEIAQMREAIGQAESLIKSQMSEQEAKGNEIKELELNCQAQRVSATEVRAMVNLYQETLQPMQDMVNGLRSKLEAISETLNQAQETGDYQLQAIAQMQQTIASLTN
ncbi:MAG: pilus motility taxis protein HmpF [Hormoscilla sp.]